mmetsp:Transcript_3058/g.4721  ORF Transcript_3058/g.4721 Transcript_3058/m.4721 type:complete len:636 (+) Transcript_3058:1017-2924(+)
MEALLAGFTRNQGRKSASPKNLKNKTRNSPISFGKVFMKSLIKTATVRPLGVIPFNLGKSHRFSYHFEELKSIQNYKVKPNSQTLNSRTHTEKPQQLPKKSTNSGAARVHRHQRTSTRASSVQRPNYRTSRLASLDSVKPLLRSNFVVPKFCQTEIEEKFEGEYNAGQKSGQGKSSLYNGDTYTGDWVGNLKQGEGVYFYSGIGATYEGEWQADKKHGKGKLTFKNGDILHGKWEEDFLSETSVTLCFLGGEVYKGNFNQLQMEGVGKLEYKTGGKYQGEFLQNKRRGAGFLSCSNSIFFEGHFANDSTDGEGMLLRRDILTKKDSRCFPKELLPDSKFEKITQIELGPSDIVYFSVSKCYCETLSANTKKGSFWSGKLQGAGVAIYGAYGYYVGNFSNGKREGWGQMVYRDPQGVCEWFNEKEGEYLGFWKDDKRHGKGIMHWNEGSKYEGRFSNDKRHNVSGKMWFSNGDYFEGGWVSESMHGIGVYKTKKGLVFKGKFEKGQSESYGTLEYPDRRKYEGDLFKFVPDGKGQMWFPDGSIYLGEFSEGEIEGRGKMVFSNREAYEGEWRDSVRYGDGVMVYLSGEVYQGEWKDDKREGNGVLKDSFGRVIYEGHWDEDAPDGKGRMNYLKNNL